jgi:hypothetical protein
MKPVRLIAAAALSLAVSFGATAAQASIGVGVGTPPLTLPASIAPGTSAKLRPNLYVVNTGTVAATYTFKVERISQGTGTSVPSTWVLFSPAQVVLDPQAHASVTVTVHVPAGAAAGGYFSDVVATASASGPSSGSVAVGAAAAALLRFDVSAPSRSLLSTIGWPWPGPVDAAAVAGLVLLVLFVAWRRLGLRLSLQRSPRESAISGKEKERG